MKIIYYIILLFVFTSCKGQIEEETVNEKFSFEVEDSDESYDMSSWSVEKKTEYFKIVGSMLQKHLLANSYKLPNSLDFQNKIQDILNISIDTTKTYQIFTLHKNNNDDYSAKEIIIFPKYKILAYNNELPLIDDNSIKYYNSEEFKNMDHSYDNNLNLNKLFFDDSIDYKNAETAIENLKESNIKIYGNSIDKYISDLNQDGVDDHILILKDKIDSDQYNRDHFNLWIKIQRGTSNGTFIKWKDNNNLIFSASSSCISEGFQNVVTKDNYFTIEQQICYDYNIMVFSYTTFKVIDNEIYLHKYGEEYFDKSNHERNIPDKIWTSKDFGKIKFDDINEEFLLNLRQKEFNK